MAADDMAMVQNTTRFGIAGLGHHAETLAAAIAAADGATLVAGASRSAERAAEFGAKFSVDGHGSYEELLARDDIDVLIVATANNMHRDLTVQALERGMNVLCEKPMALTEADADAMVAAAQKHGRSIFIGYYLRFLDAVTEMRSSVSAGDIGTPLDLRAQRYSQHSTSTFRQDLAQAGAGVLCDVAVHLIDLISFVTAEEVVSVHATARPAREENVPEDHIVLTLSLAGGGIATVDSARGIVGGENDFHIHGSSGAVCSGPLRWADTHEVTLTSHDNVRKRSFPEGSAYAWQIEGVVAALRGAPSDVARSEDGHRGVRVLAAAIRSLESGRTEPVTAASGSK